MDKQRWKQIDVVFEQMLEIEPGERADALARMCAGDDDLRRRVEELLEQEEPAEDFLKSSAIAGLAGELAGGLSALTPGQQIGQYEIKERIGAGGMGEVWRAWDEKLDRDVAIKVLPPEFSADAERAQRFEREARTIARLKHSNIITIHDIVNVADEAGGLRFIVTELVEGRTLRERLNDSQVGWREATLIATQIADALNAVHAVKIIHRDIKPENVMIQSIQLGGRVKLLDFGIAKWGGVATTGDGGAQPAAGIQTRLGVTPGTLKYMSPAQARGGEQLDARTDVFSLGLVLYEMIAGRHPFAGRSDDEIVEWLKSEDEIPPVAEAQAEIPAALDRIVAKALRKNRDERYSSGGEMLADLERLKSLIEVGGGEKEEKRLRAENADQLLTQFVVFHDADRKTRIPLTAQWTIRRFAELKRGKLERELLRKSLVSGLTKALVGAVAITPDGRRVASASDDASVIVWDAARGMKEATLLWHPIRVNAISFSTDGKSLASSDLDGNLSLWDVDGRRLRWAKRETKRVPAESGYCVAVSPDGRWVATSFAVYETGEGRMVHDFRSELADSHQGIPQPTEIRGVAFSANGQWLIDVTTRGEIARRRVGQWQATVRVSVNGRHPVSLSLSPDGERFVTGEDEGAVRLWRVDPLAEVAVIGKHDARIKSVAFSPDGREVVSASDDKTICLWDVGGRKLVTRVGTHTSPVLAVAFSPDGKQIVSGERDHSVRLYTRHRGLWGWRLD